MKLPTLPEVLLYDNLRVLKMYRKNYPQSKLSPEKAFKEVLKYLWLTQKHSYDMQMETDTTQLPKNCVMLLSMQEIDNMWHEFILVTKDYTYFCEKYFGKYLHHLPDIPENLPGWKEDDKREVEKLLPYIYDHLGEETLRIWFKDYIEPS
jgi:hypothetical protein